MAESIMLDKAKDFAVEIINMCKNITKCFNEIPVEKNEIADYNVFTEIPEKYGALEQIPESIRKTISLYMQANNLKLKEGIHSFDSLYGTLDDYINEQFVFEPIK